MKKTIITALAISAGCSALAQQTSENILSGYRYNVEGSLLYEVTGSTPNTDISFYSQRDGGKELKKVRSDNSGHLLVAAGKDFVPALIVNTNAPNEAKVSGSGALFFFGSQAFSLNDMIVRQQDGGYVISWSAAVTHPEEYVFEVLKKTEGGEYIAIASVPATSAMKMGYSVADQDKPAGDYRIRVAGKNGNNYVSRTLLANGTIHLFPTIATNTVHLILDRSDEGRYSIVNVSGKEVQSGLLKKESEVMVGNLPPGNYLMRVTTAQEKVTLKFVKE